MFLAPALTCTRCADACYRLCTSELKQNNVLTVTLFQMATWFQSVVGGDSSLSLWMRKGASVAAVTAFGLHRDSTADGQRRARIYTQQERCDLCNAVILDTMLATFMGRPVSLSFRHISTPLPWDISTDVIMDDSISIDDKLDSNGWNTEGAIHPATTLRVLMIGCTLRQQVLELCFANESGDRSTRIDDMRRCIDEAFEQYPPIHRTIIHRSAMDVLTPFEFVAVCSAQMMRLHSLFLLERIERTPESNARMLEVAKQELGLIVMFHNLRDKLPGHTDTIVWHASITERPMEELKLTF